MEQSSEILDLVREIRENQRELLAFIKEWREKSDLQHQAYQEWQDESKKATQEWDKESASAIARWDEVNKRWDEANKLWVRQIELHPYVEKTLLVLRIAAIVLLGIIAAALWLK